MKYILLSAAKNEEQYIGEAIKSVIAQSVHPLAWFIMDDGSTDKTAQIVRDYAAQYSFIRLHSAGERGGRNFGSQYKAITAAYALAQESAFDFLAVQDADIAPERVDYFESLLKMFHGNPRLGIAGGYIYERSKGKWSCRKSNAPDSVAGGIQMFRRACFDQIGGFTPLYLGGSDWLAQLDARMAGWEIAACPEFPVRHYRPTSSANGRLLGYLQLGYLDASFGTHPVFEIFKCARRISTPPIFLAALLRFAGYVWWKCSGRDPLLPPEKVVFLRKEQMAKISQWIWRLAPARPKA